jgi:threonine dehydrogenase-like Zn-dependent dehydrogenase
LKDYKRLELYLSVLDDVLLLVRAAGQALRPTQLASSLKKVFCNQDNQFNMPSKAIVIGSGMVGLAAAQVLSRHFEQVVVVERDRPQPLMHCQCGLL